MVFFLLNCLLNCIFAASYNHVLQTIVFSMVMLHSKAEAEDILNRIAEAVEAACGVSIHDMREQQRSQKKSTARGVFLLMAKRNYVHISYTCEYLHRSRCSCVITTQRYNDYFFAGDILVKKLFEDTKAAYDKSDTLN